MGGSATSHAVPFCFTLPYVVTSVLVYPFLNGGIINEHSEKKDNQLLQVSTAENSGTLKLIIGLRFPANCQPLADSVRLLLSTPLRCDWTSH